MSKPDRRPGRTLALIVLGSIVLACGSPSPSPTQPAPAASERPATPSPTVETTQPPVSGSATPTAGGDAFDPDALTLTVETVDDGLEQPIDIAVPDDDSGRVFVVEQAGRIRTLQDGQLVSEPFLDIRERISSGGERGLLGLAFHPDFPADPRLFVNYTDRAGDTVVAEYQLDGTGEVGDAESERILLQIDQPYPNHNGGAVVFGPDGMLYISTGDGGAGGDPHGNGQRLDTLLGKILRIDVDGTPDDGSSYRIPDDNPFVDTDDAMPEIWLTGLRNPWRIRFDGGTGNLWIGDVGQGSWEEIDVAPPGEGGLNFGWNRMEGFDCFEPRSGCDEAGLTLPVAAYGHEFGCAVIGGVVVRDPGQPLFDGGYVFSDSCSGILWVLDAGDPDRQEPTIVGESNRSISAIELDADGTVLATDRGSGELVRILATP
jgi:glucose/arabinose dehydrogenase